MILRAASFGDLSAILSIYNDVIATSTAVYSETPVTIDERRQWFQMKEQLAQPVIVAVENDDVVGFGSYSAFRSWPGYVFTVEHSVHVHRDHRGRGMGSRLLRELMNDASLAGKHMMIGAIDADNQTSIRLHERLGFVRCGHLREVGTKFGRWLDLVLVQRCLKE